MPSDITGSLSDTLAGKTVVVGVTGSIAAVRVVDLIRDLIRRGAQVHCVMSAAAQQILHPYALEYATAHPVITEITGQVSNGGSACGHLSFRSRERRRTPTRSRPSSRTISRGTRCHATWCSSMSCRATQPASCCAGC